MNLKAVPDAKPAIGHERNPGFPLDLDWVERTVMNRSALERRAASFSARRSVKKHWQAAWLLKAITMIDLTTLNSDDTDGRVERLCAKARHPVREDVLEALGAESLDIKPGAVCVYHNFVATAVRALRGTNIPVAAVSTAFPHGLTPLNIRLQEIEASVKAGAKEIDIVIERGLVLTGDWQALYDQVKQMRAACGDAHIKTILGTGELATLTNVAKASLVCMLAGADFIKTSTGKEKVNANLPTSLAMVRMIRESGADAVTLQEVTPSMRAAVETLRDIYPRQLHCRNAIRIGGVSVLSKVDGPKGRCAETRLLAASLPVRFAGHDVAVTSLHLNWPWPHAQNEQVARLATFFPANGLPVVMAGDLNAAPWSATAARLARMSGTTVATGYRPSWLATELPEVVRPWIGLPIDHAFAPQDMRLVSARVLGDAGSDHLPVLFEFSPKDR